MPKRKLRVKGPRTKVRTRNMYDGIQGTTVRVLDDKQLPTGCSVLNDGIPCVFRMASIDVKVERMWLPEEDREVPVVKMLGYCKKHTPKHREVTLHLDRELERRLNGPKTQKARMRRMENALYVDVVPQGGVLRHKLSREQVPSSAASGYGWLRRSVTTACGKKMKQGYIPTLKETREDYDKECPKCITAITVVAE